MYVDTSSGSSGITTVRYTCPARETRREKRREMLDCLTSGRDWWHLDRLTGINQVRVAGAKRVSGELHQLIPIRGDLGIGWIGFSLLKMGLGDRPQVVTRLDDVRLGSLGWRWLGSTWHRRIAEG